MYTYNSTEQSELNISSPLSFIFFDFSKYHPAAHGTLPAAQAENM
jgi:hypothetical protein